jgi:hypothetical protein
MNFIENNIVPKVLEIERLILTEGEKHCSKKYCSYFSGLGLSSENNYPYCNLFQAGLNIKRLGHDHKVERCNECLEAKVILDKGNVPSLSLHKEKMKHSNKQKFEIGDRVRILSGYFAGEVVDIERISTYRRERWDKKRSRKEYCVYMSTKHGYRCFLSYQLEKFRG